MKIENKIQIHFDQPQSKPEIFVKNPPDDPPPNPAEIARNVIGELANYGNQMRDKLTGAFNDFLNAARSSVINNAAWQGIPENVNLASLAPGKQQDPEALAALQKFLVGAGYLAPPESIIPPYKYGDNFGSLTRTALAAFQKDNKIDPPTGQINDKTIDALHSPRPRPGYGQNTLDGSKGPQYYGGLLEAAAGYFAGQLGEPVSGAVLQRNGSVVQYYENGIVRKEANGKFSLTDYNGNSLISAPDYAAIKNGAGSFLISQLDGDADGANNNCGYTSLLMGLKYLGVTNNQISTTATNNYDLAMALRSAGGDGTDDENWSTPAGIYNAADSINGVNTSAFGPPDLTNEQSVERMKLALLSDKPRTAFVVAGNPATGWGGTDSPFNGQYQTRTTNPYNGGHFVTVVGYNPETDKFLVLDPVANAPIEVSSQQMGAYMSDDNVQYRDVLQMTYTPPAG